MGPAIDVLLKRCLALSVTLGVASPLAACDSGCVTNVLSVTVQDETTGDLLCDARVTFGAGDAGVVIDGSVPSSDAEVPATSGACQWDVIVGGGTFTVSATAPGFSSGSATVSLPTDECGTNTTPIMLILERG